MVTVAEMEAAADWSEAVAIDCEMVMIEGGGSALARCCVVAWNEEVLVDTYCAPPANVIDYLTRYSGIRASDLDGAPPFAEVRSRVASLLDGRVVIGHGVSSDFRALKLVHPPEQIVDTQDLDWGPGRALNLRALSLEILGTPIQQGGHCPHEDALATLRLMKVYHAPETLPLTPRVTARMRTKERPLWAMACDDCEIDCLNEADELSGQTSIRNRQNSAAEVGEWEWLLTLPLSTGGMKQLLELYRHSSHGEDASHPAATPLRFPSSLPRQYRELIHKGASVPPTPIAQSPHAPPMP